MRSGRFALPALTSSFLMAAGCSDPTAPSATGAIAIFVSEPTNGQTCGQTHNSVIPPDATVGFGGPGSQRVVNGQGGADVSCQLRGSTFNARIQQASATMGTQTVAISGSVTDGEPGSATISHFRSQTGQTLRSPDNTPCNVSPAEVSSKRVFAQFTCNALNDPPSNFCIATGYFVFENCE